MVNRMTLVYLVSVLVMCLFMMGCSKKQQTWTVHDYQRQLEQVMDDMSIENLAVVTLVDYDWCCPSSTLKRICTYKLLYSFDPEFRTGDVIVMGISTEETPRLLWSSSLLSDDGKSERGKLLFIGLSKDNIVSRTNMAGYYGRQTLFHMMDDTWPIPPEIIFSTADAQDVIIETNKLFEAYFILQNKYAETSKHPIQKSETIAQ